MLQTLRRTTGEDAEVEAEPEVVEVATIGRTIMVSTTTGVQITEIVLTTGVLVAGNTSTIGFQTAETTSKTGAQMAETVSTITAITTQ